MKTACQFPERIKYCIKLPVLNSLYTDALEVKGLGVVTRQGPDILLLKAQFPLPGLVYYLEWGCQCTGYILKPLQL